MTIKWKAEREKNRHKKKDEGVLDSNGWDWVPVVSDIRSIIRGMQVAELASGQLGFNAQQYAFQSWHNNCYGQCHYTDYVDPIPGTTIGGPMPDTPLVDTYSEGMGEAAGGALSLAQTLVLGKTMRTMPEPKLDTPRFGIRVAPFGNENLGGPLASNLPHFHFRVGPGLGQSYPGLGWRWHHPWDDIGRVISNLFK